MSPKQNQVVSPDEIEIHEAGGKVTRKPHPDKISQQKDVKLVGDANRTTGREAGLEGQSAQKPNQPVLDGTEETLDESGVQPQAEATDEEAAAEPADQSGNDQHAAEQDSANTEGDAREVENEQAMDARAKKHHKRKE